MPYCTWTDVLAVYPEASNITGLSTTALRDALLEKASGLVDNFLSPVMHTPVEPRTGGAGYDPIIVEACACLGADLAVYRKARGTDDISTEQYPQSGRMFTGTRHMHRAMGMLDALYGALAAIDEKTTAGEVATPEVLATLSTTNGTLSARYAGGRYQGETSHRYVVTITSSGGTVAAGTLAVTVTRDDGEEVLSEQLINSGGWYSVEHGLQLRFTEAASSAVWTQDEYWTLNCYPPEAQDVGAAGGVSSRPLVLG